VRGDMITGAVSSPALTTSGCLPSFKMSTPIAPSELTLPSFALL
jgi:hypothetical protein